jgi:hypothetical protein
LDPFPPPRTHHLSPATNAQYLLTTIVVQCADGCRPPQVRLPRSSGRARVGNRHGARTAAMWVEP